MKPKQISGVPQQQKGGFHDTESQINFDNAEMSARNYEILKNRFFSVNNWKNYCGEKSADFKLYDSFGNHITRSPQNDDFIRINIPGPGNLESKGYEWVKIIKIRTEFSDVDEIENITMNCIPSKVPGESKNNHIAHFYSEKSSSTFIISRGSKYIKIGIYGRNEIPNMNSNFSGKIRNLIIAVGGMLGISKIQWKVLADKILEY